MAAMGTSTASSLDSEKGGTRSCEQSRYAHTRPHLATARRPWLVVLPPAGLRKRRARPGVDRLTEKTNGSIKSHHGHLDALSGDHDMRARQGGKQALSTGKNSPYAAQIMQTRAHS